jgi:hypothetical protein
MCTTSTKDIQNNKEAKNSSRGSREIFSGFFSLQIEHKTTDTERPIDKNKRKLYYSLGEKKRSIIKNQLTVNKDGFILHNVAHKKGRKHDYILNIYSIYTQYIRITILSFQRGCYYS